MKNPLIFTLLLLTNIAFSQNDFSHVQDSIKNIDQNKFKGAIEKLGLKGGEQVKIFVIFSIDEEGDVVDIKSRSVHRVFEEEAIRIVKLLPKMTPAVINGKKIKQRYSLPIVFEIESEKQQKSREKKEQRKKERQLKKQKKTKNGS